MPAATKRPTWMLSTCVAVPEIGARTTVWSKSRCALSSAALACAYSGNCASGRFGIAEQLAERGVALLDGELRLQLRGHQRGAGGIDVGLRAGLRFHQRELAIEVALLELDILLRQIDQRDERC